MKLTRLISVYAELEGNMRFYNRYHKLIRFSTLGPGSSWHGFNGWQTIQGRSHYNLGKELIRYFVK